MGLTYIKSEDAAQRLTWAVIYRHYTKEDFERVYWSDGCTIERDIGLRPEIKQFRVKLCQHHIVDFKLSRYFGLHSPVFLEEPP